MLERMFSRKYIVNKDYSFYPSTKKIYFLTLFSTSNCFRQFMEIIAKERIGQENPSGML